MKRVLFVTLVLAAVSAGVIVSAGAGNGEGATKYWIELDNAFGLIEGGDLKVSGVRAGRVSELKLDRKTKRALVGIEITKTGFDSLRTDTFCESRPQSLIGEYFIDCKPGVAASKLPPGSTIPVARTASTVPADLVNDIMRLPYRERLRIILAELGAGVAARGDDLNETIRRASPALRETDRVLAILGRQNQTLKNLVENGDKVIGDLAGNKEDVSRWIKEAGETATISATRREDIARGLHRLPGFLAELEPTMKELGRAADAQTPGLRNLRASANQLRTLFEQLKPFSEATRVNLRSLSKAADVGIPAVKGAKSTVAELNRFSQNAGELGNNFNIIFKHLNDRNFATEPNERSPGGKGFTGLEALLQYVYFQALSINTFNGSGYFLKVNAFEGECSAYQNPESLAEKVKEDPEFYKRCASILGPSQPGILQPDPTKPKTTRARQRDADTRHEDKRAPDTQARSQAPADAAPGTTEAPPIDIGQTLDSILGQVPGLKDPLKNTPDVTHGAKVPVTKDAVLDYLFGT